MGNVVEFIDTQKIICGVVIDKKNLRLRLLTEHNREVTISMTRLCLKSDRSLEINLGRDKLVATLKQIAGRRRTLSEQIDIPSLWEVLNSEQEWIDLTTMSSFCFPETTGDDHVSATLRAFFNDRLYFKFKPDRFFPHTVAQVEQITAQLDNAARQERLIHDGATWMQNATTGRQVPAPNDADVITEILSSYYLFEKESPHAVAAKAICKRAGADSPKSIFNFLVNIGIWQPDENLDLLRYQISTEFPEVVEVQAGNLFRSSATVTNGRRDLRDLPLVTIDGPSTQDFDDALSVTQENDHLVLGIHIADVGYHISKADPLDEEAMTRASSIYLPDHKIPMLPTQLSEDLCSLKADQERPAISTLIRITPSAKILDCRIQPSIVRVKQQLTFQDVDDRIAEDDTLRKLNDLARQYREQRLDNGALSIDLPEINIWLDGNGRPNLATVDRVGAGRLMVAELMILANDMASRHLSKNSIPAIYRSQPEPRERLFSRDKGTLFQNWMQRKLIRRLKLGSTPEPHSGLGLPGYVTTTSPIRKYTDLITQRQLRATAGIEAPYTQKEIDAIITALEKPMAQVGRTQYARHRYWLLKYLEGCIGQKKEGIVLFKRRNSFVVLLPEYLIECTLSGAQAIRLKPEDLVHVTIQHVNARNDTIDVYFG